MANDAVKKRDRKASQVSALYLKITLGVQAFYLLFRVLLLWKSFSSFWSWIVLSVTQLICYNLIISAIANGRPYSYYQDILYIAWFIQALLVITDYAWFVGLLIPGYMLYKLSGYVFSALKSTETADVQEIELTEKERKKLAKLERKNKQQEGRFGRRPAQ